MAPKKALLATSYGIIIASFLYGGIYLSQNNLVLFLFIPVLLVFLLLTKLNKWPPKFSFSLDYFFLVVAAIYLLFSSTHLRSETWDALVAYYMRFLLLADKAVLSYYDTSSGPYLMELLLAKVNYFMGLVAANFVFGLIVILSAYSSYFLVKKLTANKSVSVFSTLILVASPAFLNFATLQFKVEPFLLLLSNLGLLFLIKSLSNKPITNTVLAFVFFSAATLVKANFFVYVPIFVIGQLIIFVKTRCSILLLFKIYALSALAFCLPIILWGLVYGIKLTAPPLGAFVIHSKIAGIHQSDGLTRNLETTATCFAEYQKKDFTQYMGDYTPLVGYVFSTEAENKTLDITNPGLPLFLSIFLAPVFLVVFWKIELISKRNLVLIGIPLLFGPATLVMWLKGTTWYLYPLYPLYAMLFPVFLGWFESINKKLAFLTQLFIATLCTLYLILEVSLWIRYYNFATNTHQVKPGSYTQEVYENSKLVERALAPNKKVLNAAQFPALFFYTYIENSDQSVVNSLYYFANEDLSLEEMHNDLLTADITHVIAYKDSFDHPWYEACSKLNNERLAEFLERYTKPIEPTYKSEKGTFLFELID